MIEKSKREWIEERINRLTDEIEKSFLTYNPEFKEWCSACEFCIDYRGIIKPEIFNRLAKALTETTVNVKSFDEARIVPYVKAALSVAACEFGHAIQDKETERNQR